MKTPPVCPTTNLLGHEALLAWYREAESLENTVLCPLVARIPGVHTPRALPCDCPRSRQHFLVLRPECHQGGECLPRAFWPWPNSLVGEELQHYYRR